MKKKVSGVSLETILDRQFKKKPELRVLFDEKRFYLQIARLVTNLRMKAGFTQAAVARAAGVSQPLVARLERGDPRRAPTFDTIYRLLKVLGYQLEIHATRRQRRAA